jgi:hypothetical protein
MSNSDPGGRASERGEVGFEVSVPASEFTRIVSEAKANPTAVSDESRFTRTLRPLEQPRLLEVLWKSATVFTPPQMVGMDASRKNDDGRCRNPATATFD